MKRFDKGYIFSSLLSDLFGSIIFVFIFLNDLFLDEEIGIGSLIDALPLFAAACLAVYLCFTVYRILYYRTSGYELTDHEIKCNRGVLFQKRSVLDYRKIHAINKKQTIFHRIFGIAILTVDSGSTNTSHQAEIVIVETSKTVDALLEELNAYKNGAPKTADKPREEILLSEEDSLYRFSSKRKLLYTLIQIASTALGTMLFALITILVIAIGTIALGWDGLGLYAVLITVGSMLLFSLFSLIGGVVRSFVGYHNFTVTKKGRELQISFGLLERHTNTFGYDRIKAVKISQGLVQRALGFASIKLEVIGYTNDSGNDNNTELGVLVPFCKYDEVTQILRKILPDFVPDEKQTKAVSYFPFISYFSLILAITTGLILLQVLIPMLIFSVSSLAIAVVAIAVLAAGVIVLAIKAIGAALAYRNNGLALSHGKITAYYGGWTKNVAVFSAENLIAAESVTTPLRQKAGIASLVMHLKTNAITNEIKVHIQRSSLSDELEKQLIL